MLTVRNLAAKYGAATILNDVSLEVRAGEIVALLGRNGAGKSTTMKAVMGLVPPTGGTVEFDGRSLRGYEPYQIARLGLGYVPEDRRIFGGLTVAENLSVARRKTKSIGPNWSLASLYELFPNLAELSSRKGSQISGGEQQMLTISRTLIGNPILVLLDEPSEGLAPKIVEQMAGAITKISASGIAVLLSEQNMHFASLVSDRAYVIERGQIRYSGSMADLATNIDVRRNHLAL